MAGRKKSNVPTRSTSLTINEGVFDAIEDVRWDHKASFSRMVEKMAVAWFEAQGTPIALAAAPTEGDAGDAGEGDKAEAKATKK